jgi:predicted DNA-binding transcriptional regulator AlpA
MTAQDQFLDTAQAAHYLGYSMSALEYWRTKSLGPKYYKLNRRVRYKQSDLDAWLEARLVTPVKEAV